MKKQSFFFGSAVLILSAVIAKLMGAVFRIPLANLLGGTGMGYFSGAYGIFMTVYAVSVTGLPAAVAKLTAENSALERYANLRRVKSTALLFFTAAGLVFTLLTLLLSHPFCVSLNNSPETLPAALAIAPSVLFGCMTSVYRGYYEGLRNMFPTAVSQIIEGLFKLLLGLALCVYVLKNPEKVPPFFGNGENALLSAAAAAAVLGITLSTAAGTLFLVLRDKLFGDGITPEQLARTNGKCLTDSRRSIVSALLKTAVPIAAGALVTNLTSLIDLVTIMRSLERAAAVSPDYFAEKAPQISARELPNFLFGSFTGLAVTVFNLVPSFTNMFGKGILPSLAEGFAEKDSGKIRLCTEKALFATALIAFPSGVGICVLSGEILRVLFPAKPLETGLCTLSLSILGIGVIFLCISATVFAALQAAGRAELPVKFMLLGVAVKLVGNLLLVGIPEINIAGAAFSTTLCYGVICVPALGALIKITNVDKSRIKSIFLKMGYCSLMCGGGALLAKNMLADRFNPVLSLGISVLFGVIFYIISTFLLGIITKSTLKMLIS
ncbi:MAG: polysaccharide biosynthesis C-terminal domain-containing protein [Oscillospiraceae bacterium]|nr:polysaccharide biosynthesis C-terminal domain-containing protein [Oscillospiraceae bacterium]